MSADISGDRADGAALEKLAQQVWEQTLPAVRKTIRRRVRDRQDAEDLEIKVHARWTLACSNGLVATDRNPAGYLVSTTKNAVVDHLRRQQRQPVRVALTGEVAGSLETDGPADRVTTHVVLEAVQARLDPEEIDLLGQRAAGASCAAMAEARGVSPAALESRIRRLQVRAKVILLDVLRGPANGRCQATRRALAGDHRHNAMLESHLPDCEDCEESRRALLAAAEGVLGVGMLLPATLPTHSAPTAATIGRSRRRFHTVGTTIAGAVAATVAAIVVGVALFAERPTPDAARDPMTPATRPPPSTTSRPPSTTAPEAAPSTRSETYSPDPPTAAPQHEDVRTDAPTSEPAPAPDSSEAPPPLLRTVVVVAEEPLTVEIPTFIGIPSLAQLHVDLGDPAGTRLSSDLLSLP